MIDRDRIKAAAAAAREAKDPAVAPRPRRILPWRVPYATIHAFVTSRSVEEREERRPGLKGALRELRRSVFSSKRPQRGAVGWNGTTEVPDPALNVALMVMLQEICANAAIDEETRSDLMEAFDRIISLGRRRRGC
jgi:hypothetical protein